MNNNSQKSRYKFFVGIKGRSPVTHHGDDLLSYASFLDSNFPDWFHFIVYDNRAPDGEKGAELARFTKTDRPLKKIV